MIYQIDYHAFCAYIGPKRLLSGREIAKGFISETNCTQDYLKRSRSNPWFRDKDHGEIDCSKPITCPIADFVAALPSWYSGSGIIGKVVVDNWQPQLHSMWNLHTRAPKDIYWLDEDGLIKEISKQFARDIDKIYMMGPTPESSAVITGIDWGEKDISIDLNNESRYFTNLGKMMKEMKGEMRVDLTQTRLNLIGIKDELIEVEQDYKKLQIENGQLKRDNNALTTKVDYWKQLAESYKSIIDIHVCNCNPTPEDPFAANRQNNPFWVDREGVKQHIQSLDDKHLINIFNVLNNEARYGENPPKMRYILNEFKRRGISVQRG